MALRFFGGAVAIGDRCGGVWGGAVRLSLLRCSSAAVHCSPLLSLLYVCGANVLRCLGSVFIRQDVSLFRYVCEVMSTTDGASGDARPSSIARLSQHRFSPSAKISLRAPTDRDRAATTALWPPLRAAQPLRSSPQRAPTHSQCATLRPFVRPRISESEAGC